MVTGRMRDLQTLCPAARGITRALLLVLLNFISPPQFMAFAPAESVVAPATGVVASTEDTEPILVKFKSGALKSDVDAAIKSTGGTELREHSPLRLHVLQVPAASREAVPAVYARHPFGEWAEPAHRVRQAGSPNDPLYAQQWGLPQISWGKAFRRLPIPGSSKITVLHTGIGTTHTH